MDPWKEALRVWKAESEGVASLSEIIDARAFRSLVNLLALCKGRVLTAGVGTSAAAARKIAHSLCCIERPALFLSPGDAVHGGLGVVQKGDVVIAISDILGRTIMTPAVREAACLGAALLAGSACGTYRDIDEAVRATVRPDVVYSPKAELHKRYSERFMAYQTLYPSFKSVNRILSDANHPRSQIAPD